MKLKSGDMLIMDERNAMLKIQIIGRDDVPRVEREGRGWRDGAMAVLKGADVAVFQDALDNASGEFVIGDSGLSMKIKCDKLSASGWELPCIVLSIKGVSVELARPERTMLVWAVRGLAWRMFA